MGSVNGPTDGPMVLFTVLRVVVGGGLGKRVVVVGSVGDGFGKNGSPGPFVGIVKLVDEVPITLLQVTIYL